MQASSEGCAVSGSCARDEYANGHLIVANPVEPLVTPVN